MLSSRAFLRYCGTFPRYITPHSFRRFSLLRSEACYSARRTLSTTSDQEHEHFYRYTSGRWLWDEEKQLRERYRKFNVSELQQLAIRSVGAKACSSMIKLAEGGFNKVFRLSMDNASVVIARIPNPNAGPPHMTIASEVATMEFARSVLNIPIPKVIAWSGAVDNPVGSEYMLMEEAAGTQLGEVWEDLELPSKLQIVEEVVAIEKKFLSLSFTQYGNLYFASDAFPGCVEARVVGEVPQLLKQEVATRSVIGPVADREFWHKERAIMSVDRGPWQQPSKYLRATGKREIEWLSRHAVTKPPGDLLAQSKAQRTPAAHKALYEKFLKVSDHLLPAGALAKPTLWVTSLIDWQDVWISPLFLQARQPRLVRHNGEMLLRLPENYESLTDQEERAKIRSQVQSSIVAYTYNDETKTVNPLLEEIVQLPQWRTRRDTVDFSSNTWDGNMIPFRQCLIRIARHWKKMDADMPCPIGFTNEEIQEHHQDGEGWNDIADFWDSLEGIVNRDGWTSNETYEQALEIFAQLREQGLLNLGGEERDEFDKSTRWAERRT